MTLAGIRAEGIAEAQHGGVAGVEEDDRGFSGGMGLVDTAVEALDGAKFGRDLRQARGCR